MTYDPCAARQIEIRIYKTHKTREKKTKLFYPDFENSDLIYVVFFPSWARVPRSAITFNESSFL